MFTLSLAVVDRGEAQVEGEIPVDDPVWEDTDLALRAPLQVKLRAQRVGEGVLVRGRMSATLIAECRRCLVEVPLEIDDDFDLLYEPFASEQEEQELSGEVYALPARGAHLDLRPALREQLLLRVPAHVVCKEACRGLCPRCGADLNQTTCSCSVESEPTAWDVLKKLKFD